MERAVSRSGRRTGWSETENQLLWETADEAQQQGLPLKSVFESIAERTGRRPNSIRNYYYAQVRQREGAEQHPARFVPFTQDEVDWLMEQVLVARAAGQSVRSCLQKLSGGDHSLMLRYQNKYRAVIKSRPDYVQQKVDELNGRGVPCEAPRVNHRPRADVNRACERLEAAARDPGDADLARACDTIAGYLRDRRPNQTDVGLLSSAQALIDAIKDFLARPDAERRDALDGFCDLLASKVGELESRLPLDSAVVDA